MKIRTLLENKSSPLVTVGPQGPVCDAARKMADFKVGILVVIDDGRLVGVFSERQLVRALGTSNADLSQAKVRDIMTDEILTCGPDDPMVDAVYGMNKLNVRHIVVVSDGNPIGVIGMRDVLGAMETLLDERKLAEFLEPPNAA